MSWLSWILGGEDKHIAVGWKMLRLYGHRRNDPYYAFGEWDDKATSEGSFESKIVSLDRHIEAGLAQLTLLQSEFKEGTYEWGLGEFYKTVWPHLVGFFWEGKR